MKLRFDRTGPLRRVLEEFRKTFLDCLSEEDLARPVRLTVREETEKEPDPAADLREKIVEVLSDE